MLQLVRMVLLMFGAMTFLEAPLVERDLRTPWIGLWERINITVFLLRIAVLAKALMRGPYPEPEGSRASVNTSGVRP